MSDRFDAADVGRVDVLAYTDADGDTVHRAVPAGDGADVVAAHEEEWRRRRLLRGFVGAIIVVVVTGYAVVVDRLALGGVAAAIVVAAFVLSGDDRSASVPEVVAEDIDRDRARRRHDLDGPPADPTGG